MTTKKTRVTPSSMRGKENCRVLDLGIGNFAECLKPGPSTCSYAVPFGYCFLCKHPQVDRLIENTKKAQLTVSA